MKSRCDFRGGLGKSPSWRSIRFAYGAASHLLQLLSVYNKDRAEINQLGLICYYRTPDGHRHRSVEFFRLRKTISVVRPTSLVVLGSARGKTFSQREKKAKLRCYYALSTSYATSGISDIIQSAPMSLSCFISSVLLIVQY